MCWEVPAFVGHVFVGRGFPRDINLVADKVPRPGIFDRMRLAKWEDRLNGACLKNPD